MPASDVTGANTPSPSPGERFVPGTLLAGRYRVVAPLGRGGMGEVYRADGLTLGQPVALKFLPEHLSRDADRLARFRREVAAARKVSHPNVAWSWSGWTHGAGWSGWWRCPHRLTALARVLDGRWRDPLVGRDVLIGVALRVVSVAETAAFPFGLTDDGPIAFDSQGFTRPAWSLVGVVLRGVVAADVGDRRRGGVRVPHLTGRPAAVREGVLRRRLSRASPLSGSAGVGKLSNKLPSMRPLATFPRGPSSPGRQPEGLSEWPPIRPSAATSTTTSPRPSATPR